MSARLPRSAVMLAADVMQRHLRRADSIRCACGERIWSLDHVAQKLADANLLKWSTNDWSSEEDTAWDQ